MEYGKGLDPKIGIESCRTIIENGGACYGPGIVECKYCPGSRYFNVKGCGYNEWNNGCETCLENAKAYIEYHTNNAPIEEPISDYVRCSFPEMREVVKEKLRKSIRENEPIDRTVIGEYEFLCRMIEDREIRGEK